MQAKITFLVTHQIFLEMDYKAAHANVGEVFVEVIATCTLSTASGQTNVVTEDVVAIGFYFIV